VVAELSVRGDRARTQVCRVVLRASPKEHREVGRAQRSHSVPRTVPLRRKPASVARLLDEERGGR
jgi:hypothetical protein